MPSQEILKIRDGTPLEADGILTYRKMTSKLIGLALFYKPSQEILKIRDEILKIRDGTPLEWPSQEILKIRDGTPLEKILKIRDEPSQEILKIRDEILKIRDGTPLEADGILTYRKMTSKLLGLALF
ncbi:hypothetical protein OROGR_013237 [Orobanche gracilis]